jgi:hypothetical protein
MHAGYSLILAAVLLKPPLEAQQPRAFCFRGQPLPKCRAFALTELTGALRVAGTSYTDRLGVRSRDLSEWFSLGIGYMRNRDSVHAIGMLFEAGGSDGGNRFTATLRRRTWLTTHVSSDFSAGPLIAQQRSSDVSGTATGYGITAQAAIGAGDLVGLLVSADAIHVQNRNATALHIGARLGSYAAIGASAATLAATFALLSVLGGG